MHSNHAGLLYFLPQWKKAVQQEACKYLASWKVSKHFRGFNEKTVTCFKFEV